MGLEQSPQWQLINDKTVQQGRVQMFIGTATSANNSYLNRIPLRSLVTLLPPRVITKCHMVYSSGHLYSNFSTSFYLQTWGGPLGWMLSMALGVGSLVHLRQTSLIKQGSQGELRIKQMNKKTISNQSCPSDDARQLSRNFGCGYYLVHLSQASLIN